MNATQMPIYQCFKQVYALRIKAITHPVNNDFELPIPTLEFEEPGYAPIQITRAAFNKHQPQPGWYYVVYPDGYVSFSPPDSFESGYCRIDIESPASPIRAAHLAKRAAEAIYTRDVAMFKDQVQRLEMRIATLIDDSNDDDRIRGRMSKLLTAIAEALYGPHPESGLHDWSQLPKRVKELRDASKAAAA